MQVDWGCEFLVLLASRIPLVFLLLSQPHGHDMLYLLSLWQNSANSTLFGFKGYFHSLIRIWFGMAVHYRQEWWLQGPGEHWLIQDPERQVQEQRWGWWACDQSFGGPSIIVSQPWARGSHARALESLGGLAWTHMDGPSPWSFWFRPGLGTGICLSDKSQVKDGICRQKP